MKEIISKMLDLTFQSFALSFTFAMGYLSHKEGGPFEAILQKENVTPDSIAGMFLGLYLAILFIAILFNAWRWIQNYILDDGRYLLREIERHWEKFTPAEQQTIGNILEEQDKRDRERKARQ